MATYKETRLKALEGGIVNTENKNIISRTVETAEGIAFGKPVVRGEKDQGIRLPKSGDTKFLGITVLDRTTQTGEAKFVHLESARVLDRGVIWVKVAEDVKAGDPVTVNVTDATFGKSTESAVVFEQAVYDSSAEAGQLAQIRLK